ncbi:uncharacterized protein LOC120838077 [Ixodes scapularis]|uniref:uncharacterized protein LOC120838077 n=1 Tax=Ixodes scapularis TaxID=6945 RepID=UPI001A9FA757|nr:uncharacterized protein LOC120838077 [Ixodes scapularis]
MAVYEACLQNTMSPLVDEAPFVLSGCTYGCRVCKKNPITTQLMWVTDQPVLSDAKVLAHEMGHLLGINEEGACPGSYTPGNEKLRCKKQEHGYVLGSGKPPHYFSRCLQDQVRGCLMQTREGCFDLTGGKKIF